jgi:hypothetical protein
MIEREKRRHEESRVKKQIQQLADEKLKMEQALERATRPIQHRTGRLLLPGNLLHQSRLVVDKAQLAAMKEHDQ